MIHDVLELFTGMSCSTIEVDGQVTEVVAAGGYRKIAVSIFNLEYGVWRSGV